MKRPIKELIREKRPWHTPPDPDAVTLGFKGWYSCGYLPHFDMPGVWQMINYRLADSMPMSRRKEWSSLFEIKDDLQRYAKVEDYLIAVWVVVRCATRAPRLSWRRTGCIRTASNIGCSPGW